MSYMGPVFRQIAVALTALPDGQHFDTESHHVQFCAHTQEQMRQVIQAFPGCVWKKEWNESLNWWDYRAEFNGIPLRIYGVDEPPKTCTAITQEVEVEERVPVKWKTQKVKKTKIVGWNCGPQIVETP